MEDLQTHLYLEDGIVRAVDGVSLTIEAGEIVGLVGESGCGKTMTARSILRLLPSEAALVGGRIDYKGTNLLMKPPTYMDAIRGREIGAVFQDPLTFLNPVMKVRDQVAEAPMLQMRSAKADARAEALKLLARVGISDAAIADAYPHQLSGGMRQRVLLGIALSSKPSLLIADEPFTALDVSVQDQLMRLLKNLQTSFGFACLLITHDLGVAAELCDRIYVMYAGEIVEKADAEILFKQPKHPYTAALIAAANMDPVEGRFPSIPGSVPSLLNPPPGCRFHPRCQFAFERCSRQRPVWTDMGKGAEVRCWLYE